MDLQIRPIRHRTEERVWSYLFLCLRSYYVEWHLRRAWPRCCWMMRGCAPGSTGYGAGAQPSAAAKRKKAKRQIEDGLPIQSFVTLMAQLATRARHRCRTASDPDGPKVQRLTEPTPLQRRALELVKAFPVTIRAAS